MNEENMTAEQIKFCSAVSEEIYGAIPSKPLHLSYRTKASDLGFAAGKATMSVIEITLDFGDREAVMPITAVIPTKTAPCPTIVFLSRENSVPSKFLPAEEIVDRGYGIINLCVDAVSGADGDFKSGLGKHLVKSRRKKNAPGKVAIWAWAAMRAVDLLYNGNTADKDRIIVAGHGITAVSALLCGAGDGRVRYVIANEPLAACDFEEGGGDYLYCPAYAEAPRVDGAHLLARACREKKILIGSACDRACFDVCSDRDLLREIGITEETDASEPCIARNERAHYHRRRGCEYFSREDWSNYLDFIDKSLT